MSNETWYTLSKQLIRDEVSKYSHPRTIILGTIIAVVIKRAFRILRAQYDTWRLPLVNGRKLWSSSGAAEALMFMKDAEKLIDEGFKTAGDVFRVQTDNGIHIVLSAKFADSIKNDPNLSLPELTAQDFHANIPGFDAWTMVSSQDRMIVNIIKEHMTHRRYWHELSLPETALDIIARASSLILLGPELCDNKDWIPSVLSYIGNTHKAADDLRQWPRLLRPLVHRFLPSCQVLRADLAKCAGIVTPVLEQRRRDKQARISQGLKPDVYNDAMEWLEEMNDGRPYDAVAAHLTFAIAGVFSSTDTLTQIIYDLCDQPQLVEDLRKEIVSVVSENCWDKKTLYQLKLMDSVMKETQRLKPIGMVSMHRLAIGDIVLPDGTKIPKGTRLAVSANHSWDDSIYPEADKFDGYRFLRLREDGSKTAQFATTTSSTIGFGHGNWACPARVFASDEIKIALSHILLKYDFKLAPETKLKPKVYGFVTQADTTGRVMVRRRHEEIHQ
ncbi:hypothetical protein S40293_10179 [Stachybotrys chartarum IBT 40293]|nr:hypothetical protein S40293_10179 [Stachybotrys chartarum IBT 40293]